MATPRTIASLIIAVTIAATLFAPVANVVGDNTGDVTVTNESVTADVGNASELRGYNLDASSVSVTSGGSTVNSSEYSIDAEAGTITILANGTVSDGDGLLVSYTYAATSGTTSTVVGMVPLFLALLILGVLAGKVSDMA